MKAIAFANGSTTLIDGRAVGGCGPNSVFTSGLWRICSFELPGAGDTLSTASEFGSQYHNVRLCTGFVPATGRAMVCRYSPLFSANPKISSPGTIQYTPLPKLEKSPMSCGSPALS